MINFALRRATNIQNRVEIDKDARNHLSEHLSKSYGLPGYLDLKIDDSYRIEKKLHQLGIHTYTLDGDNMPMVYVMTWVYKCRSS